LLSGIRVSYSFTWLLYLDPSFSLAVKSFSENDNSLCIQPSYFCIVREEADLFAELKDAFCIVRHRSSSIPLQPGSSRVPIASISKASKAMNTQPSPFWLFINQILASFL
jgi:hypothetical protein